MNAIPIHSEHDWHAIRAKHIGSSEVAALFNCSPWLTKFELWHIKAGNVPPSQLDHDRIKWGERLEPAIAGGIAEDNGWLIQKVRRYLTHKTVPGMGASLDFEIINHQDGAGCFEVKNVDFLQYRDRWLESEDGNEAPIHIELQLQHQLAVSGRAWGAIGVLVGGNAPKVIIRKRHPEAIGKIERAVAAFWKSVEAKKEPEPSYGDFDAVKELYPNAKPTEPPLDLTGDDDFAAACANFLNAKADEGAARRLKERHAAQILNTVKDADAAKGLGFFVSAKTIKRGGYTVEPTEYRQLNVKETEI